MSNLDDVVLFEVCVHMHQNAQLVVAVCMTCPQVCQYIEIRGLLLVVQALCPGLVLCVLL